MVSITLSVDSKTRKKMKEFAEVNWSGFVRRAIEEKTKSIEKLAKMEKELVSEKETIDWAVKLQRASRAGRLGELKKKGLI